MHKNISRISTFIATIAICSATNAYAGFVVFGDNNKAFSGFENASFNQDEYGTPKIDNMSVEWNDTTGALENVSINLHTSTHRQLFDNLFINNDFGSTDINEQGWDYLVHAGGQQKAWANSGTTAANGLWEVAENYTYTLNTQGGRVGHPTGIDAGSLSNWSSGPAITHNGYTISYDFNGLGIDVSNGFAFAYSPWCANDIIIGSYQMDPVPEPATLILFGLGLFAFIGGKAYQTRIAKQKTQKQETEVKTNSQS